MQKAFLKQYFIGVDIGGTFVRIGLYSVFEGDITRWMSFQIKPGHSADQEVRDNICSPVYELMKTNGIQREQVKGIGLSLAANYDPYTGKIIKWPNRRLWDGFPIMETVRQYFRTEVLIEDDVNCAAIGEFSYETVKTQNLIYCGVGTGIGIGFVINSELYRGDFGMAGEIGHFKVINHDQICVCGKRGCLQAVFKTEPEKAASYLGELLFQISYILNIRNVILGGGVPEYIDGFYESVRNGFQGAGHGQNGKYLLLRSQLYHKNGVLGVIELLKKNL